MNLQRITTTLLPVLAALVAQAQFPPPAGQPGSTAIPAESELFTAWAIGCTVDRGPMDLSNAGAGPASTGEEAMAIGPASMNGVVSLGDGGSAVLTFAQPIANAPGWDLAVFENGYSDTFLELAFVEVSSNGSDFYRFPATSNTQDTVQIDGFGAVDATLVDNFAGKYRAGYGTPFDLEELADRPGLNVNAITHVKIIDAVGCIQAEHASHDRYGHVVNEPWNTPFASSGFDLDAVGVIHQTTTGISPAARASADFTVSVDAGGLHVRLAQLRPGPAALAIHGPSGKLLWERPLGEQGPGEQVLHMGVPDLPAGIVFVTLITSEGRTTRKTIVGHGH